MKMVSARELVGRRIVAFDPRPSKNGPLGSAGPTVVHEPTITLDDGSVLYFTAEELDEGGDYGVFIGRRPPPAKLTDAQRRVLLELAEPNDNAPNNWWSVPEKWMRPIETLARLGLANFERGSGVYRNTAWLTQAGRERAAKETKS